MNIHLPAILGFTRGIGFWPIPTSFTSLPPKKTPQDWVSRIWVPHSSLGPGGNQLVATPILSHLGMSHREYHHGGVWYGGMGFFWLNHFTKSERLRFYCETIVFCQCTVWYMRHSLQWEMKVDKKSKLKWGWFGKSHCSLIQDISNIIIYIVTKI